MRKTVMSLAAAAVIGTAGFAGSTQQAEAAPWWVAPAIVGGVLLGGATVAAANSNAYYYQQQPYGYYAPAGNVYVRPVTGQYANCHVGRELVPGGWRPVQVCY